MSTLEKSIQMLNTLPDKEVERIYSFIQSIYSQYTDKKISDTDENIDDILNSITGSVPDTGKTLEEYKSERIRDLYETTG